MRYREEDNRREKDRKRNKKCTRKSVRGEGEWKGIREKREIETYKKNCNGERQERKEYDRERVIYSETVIRTERERRKERVETEEDKVKKRKREKEG